jgi:excisionase family DNA binding protein
MREVEIYLTPAEAGRRFSPALSSARFRQMVDAGELGAIRTPGGWRLIRETDVLKAVQARERKVE